MQTPITSSEIQILATKGGSKSQTFLFLPVYVKIDSQKGVLHKIKPKAPLNTKWGGNSLLIDHYWLHTLVTWATDQLNLFMVYRR